jgi:hypothetical protein
MSKKNKIIMSAASVSAALSAITTMGSQDQIIETPKASSYDAAALEAISTAKAQAFVRSSFNDVSKTIRLDKDLREAIYAEVARTNASTSPQAEPVEQDQSLGMLVASSFLKDSTQGASFACYTNCHSACHGSRGWR